MGSNAVLQVARLCAKCRQAHPDKHVTYTIAHHLCVTDETLKQAVKACTAAVAYQFGWYDLTGSLEAGKSADFVILDKNIEKTDPEDIFGIKISSTYFMGKKVW